MKASLPLIPALVLLTQTLWGAIAPDVQISKDQSTASTTVTSPAFSTAAAQELLLAFISTDYLSGANTTVSSVSGGGLTWVLVGRTNKQAGSSEIWRAFAPAALSSVSVTATISQKVVSSLTVMSFTGVDTSGSNGSSAIGAVASGSASTGAPTATLTTTRAGSWVVGVGNDFDNAVARTVGTGQTLMHQYLTSTGDTYWAQRQTNAIAASGVNVSINDTAPTTDQYNLTVCEILAASGSGNQTWAISGNISPASVGSGATVLLTGAASAAVTADSSGNYSFPNLANGSYTVTPSKSGNTFSPSSQAVAVNGANVAGVNFTGSAASSSIGIDVQVSTDQSAANSAVATPVFSTVAGQELLLAFIATDYLTGANTSVKSVAGGGLTWQLVGRTNVQSGSAEIWRAFAQSPLTGVQVTATLSQSVISSITVMSFTGTDSSGTNGSGAIGAIASANASSGAPSASLVTTRNGSWVIGVGNDYDSAKARTPGAGQNLDHQYLTPAGDTYWVQQQTSPIAASGTIAVINDTAPTGDRYNLTICEILSGSGSGVIPQPPTANMIAPAPGTVASLTTLWATVSDNVAISNVQFLLDGAALGSAMTSAPYTLTWDSKNVANGTHTVSVKATNSSGQSATSSPVAITVDNSGNPAVVGSWSSAVALPAVAVNLILLHNNKILFYQDGATPTVWDYVNNVFTNVPVNPDLFCSGAALLADGRVLVVGGYGDGNGNYGIANAEIFDPATNKWTAVPNMAYKRWYPTATTLSDGRIMVTAGWQTTAHTNAGISEIYDPTANTWSQLKNANNPFETYPFLYQLGDGRVIHIGGSEYATETDILDITNQSWSVIDSSAVDGSSATMYAPGMFMKAGTATDSQNVGPTFNTTYTLDMTQPTPFWQEVPSMAYPRGFMNLTMLPDGTALATGGETDKNGGNIANAVYAAELWSPTTKTWSTLASMHTPREYHGTALLLPDGRVLESGMGADFGNVPDEKSAEFYSPPYLFKGARPTITSAPTELQYGTSFTVTTPDAGNISKVVLIRTGAVTHFFDQNERYVPLAFTQNAGSLTVTPPANSYLAPPGYYMLFIVNSNGVPSVAPFVHFAGN